MGWKDREYSRDKPRREVLVPELILGVAGRVAANALLLVPVAVALGGVAFAARWFGPEWSAVGWTAAFGAGAYALVAAAVAIVEHHVETRVPVQTHDTCAVAAVVSFLGAALVLRLALPHVASAVATVREGSALAGFEAARQNVGWFWKEPGTLAALAAPIGALAAIRTDDDPRSFFRETFLVAALASGTAFLACLTLWALGPLTLGAAPGLWAFTILVVPPVVAFLLVAAAHLGERLRERASQGLFGEES